ncbi:MAG: rod shape-determining protein MreC [Gaiellales bacterium]|nr:rod shape-determining protein MreC [Gaiellales bacterium]
MSGQKGAGRRRLVFTVLVMASLLLVTLFLRESAGGFLHSMQTDGLGAMSPLQSLATRAVEPFQDGWRYVTGLWSAYEENEKLTAEVEELRGRVIELEEGAEQNRDLKELLDFRESGIFPEGSTFVVARVIGRSPTQWEEWLQIDRGTADGLAVNQPVVGAMGPVGNSPAGKGLVGKVVAVTAHSAQVQLILDSQSSVAAKVQGGTAEGILQGSLSRTLIMDYVERDQLVEEGVVVVTSGMGGIYPRGIPVGVVTGIGEEDVNIYKQIEVQPQLNLYGLTEVMVITNPPAETGLGEGFLPTGIQSGSGSGRD